MNPWLSVALTGIVTSATVGLVGLALLQWAGRRSLRHAVWVAPATAVAAVVVGVAATANRMFLSSHDLAVVLVVCAAAGAVAVLMGLVITRQTSRLEDRARRDAEAHARAADAERARREMVAWVSHDLRTPLAGMRAMTEALQDGVAPDPARYHRQLNREVERLTSMVDDLFELSRISSGTLELVRDQVSLAEVLSDVITATRPLAEARGVHLVSRAGLVGDVNADERTLRRALSNVVTNAIGRTPHDGSVQVITSTRDGMASVAVLDGCGGIPEIDLPHVFEAGYRGDSARSPTASSGAGLGLAIVQGIVDAHSGQVNVSNVGEGCRFEILLPTAS